MKQTKSPSRKEVYSPRGRDKQMSKRKLCQLAEMVFGGSQECGWPERGRAVEYGPASLLVLRLRIALDEGTGSPGALSKVAWMVLRSKEGCYMNV